jgi:hypothetical protein
LADVDDDTRAVVEFTVMSPPNTEIGPLTVIEVAKVIAAVLLVLPRRKLRANEPTLRFAVETAEGKLAPKDSITTSGDDVIMKPELISGLSTRTTMESGELNIREPRYAPPDPLPSRVIEPEVEIFDALTVLTAMSRASAEATAEIVTFPTSERICPLKNAKPRLLDPDAGAESILKLIPPVVVVSTPSSEASSEPSVIP